MDASVFRRGIYTDLRQVILGLCCGRWVGGGLFVRDDCLRGGSVESLPGWNQ